RDADAEPLHEIFRSLDDRSRLCRLARRAQHFRGDDAYQQDRLCERERLYPRAAVRRGRFQGSGAHVPRLGRPASPARDAGRRAHDRLGVAAGGLPAREYATRHARLRSAGDGVQTETGRAIVDRLLTTATAESMTADAASNASIPALAVEGLSHSFGARKALDGVTFAIAPGSFTALLGPNGAGKTTLFSLVTRLYNNRAGSIRVFGFEVRRQPSEALSRIGAIFQQRTLDLDLTVAENLHYHAALHGMSRRETRERIEIELGRAELVDRL